MRARTTIVLSTVLALSALGIAPAHAEPTTPAITDLATPEPGRVTATVLTDQPFVVVGLTPDLAQDGTALPVVDGQAAVDLETWEYGADTTLRASACETETYAVETCSEPAEAVFDPVLFTVDAVPVLTQALNQSAATFRTPLQGTYSASWTLTRTGGPVVERGPVGGSLPANGVVSSVVALEDDDPAPAEKPLDSGVWDLAITLTITDPEFGEDPLPPATVHTTIVVDRIGPQATLGAPRTVIHPRVNLPSHPGSLTVTASGDTSEIAGWIVRKNSAPLTVVRTYPAGTSITWDGRNQQGQIVPPSVYRIHTVDVHGNLSAGTTTTSWALGVTNKRIVTATATKQISAAGALLDANVGRCSTLRKPSLRRTPGSLGLYSNTKCRSGARASQVSTVYGVRLLPALSYVSVRVYAFSGAATKRPGSRATIHYITNRGLPRLPRPLGSTIKTHAGALPPAPSAYILNLNQSGTGPMVPFFMWNVAVGGGNHYDLRDFVVRVRYKVVV